MGHDKKHWFPAPPISQMSTRLKNSITALFTVHQNLTNVLKELKGMNEWRTSQDQHTQETAHFYKYGAIPKYSVYREAINSEDLTHLLSQLSQYCLLQMQGGETPPKTTATIIDFSHTPVCIKITYKVWFAVSRIIKYLSPTKQFHLN